MFINYNNNFMNVPHYTDNSTILTNVLRVIYEFPDIFRSFECSDDSFRDIFQIFGIFLYLYIYRFPDIFWIFRFSIFMFWIFGLIAWFPNIFRFSAFSDLFLHSLEFASNIFRFFLLRIIYEFPDIFQIIFWIFG